MKYERMFEPITINGLEIPNRTVMPAMGLLYTSDYMFNDRLKEFYLERARGGVGLMIVGPLGLDPAGSIMFMVSMFDDKNIAAFKEMNDQIHAETQTKTAGQLLHQGRYAMSFLSGIPSVAPSPIPSNVTRETPRELTIEEIEEIIAAYAASAVRIKKAGFDMVEILGCTGYLMNQFLSTITNQRKDKYGGPLENRMRFGLEVVKAVREAVGDDYPVGIRLSGNDFMEGGNTNIESAKFAAAVDEAGVDVINVTGGWHETNIPQLTSNVPPGAYLYLAKGIKEAVNVPVMASNRLGDPKVAEKALRSGMCDMICWGRPMLTDPELPNKIKEGREWEIVPCISCNQGCFDVLFGGQPVRCIMNPRCGLEETLNPVPAETPKKILVVGGGVAGMQFALTAAKRGHDVTVYEKDSRLGGQLNIAMVPPGKGEFGRILTSLVGRMEHYGVKVKLDTPLTKDMILEMMPDAVVVASGAKPISINVPGIDKPHVVEAWDVLDDNVAHIGKNVVIVGGSATGCETAHLISTMDAPDESTIAFLTYHNAETPEFLGSLLHRPMRKVTVIDFLDKMATNVGRTSKWSLMKSLKLGEVVLKTQTKLLEVTDDSVIVETPDGKQTIPADTVIMAVGAAPVNKLSEEIKEEGIEVIVIGDAAQPRNLGDAVREGFEKALAV